MEEGEQHDEVSHTHTAAQMPCFLPCSQHYWEIVTDSGLPGSLWLQIPSWAHRKLERYANWGVQVLVELTTATRVGPDKVKIAAMPKSAVRHTQVRLRRNALQAGRGAWPACSCCRGGGVGRGWGLPVHPLRALPAVVAVHNMAAAWISESWRAMDALGLRDVRDAVRALRVQGLAIMRKTKKGVVLSFTQERAFVINKLVSTDGSIRWSAPVFMRGAALGLGFSLGEDKLSPSSRRELTDWCNSPNAIQGRKDD